MTQSHCRVAGQVEGSRLPKDPGPLLHIADPLVQRSPTHVQGHPPACAHLAHQGLVGLALLPPQAVVDMKRPYGSRPLVAQEPGDEQMEQGERVRPAGDHDQDRFVRPEESFPAAEGAHPSHEVAEGGRRGLWGEGGLPIHRMSIAPAS